MFSFSPSLSVSPRLYLGLCGKKYSLLLLWTSKSQFPWSFPVKGHSWYSCSRFFCSMHCYNFNYFIHLLLKLSICHCRGASQAHDNVCLYYLRLLFFPSPSCLTRAQYAVYNSPIPPPLHPPSPKFFLSFNTLSLCRVFLGSSPCAFWQLIQSIARFTSSEYFSPQHALIQHLSILNKLP